MKINIVKSEHDVMDHYLNLNPTMLDDKGSAKCKRCDMFNLDKYVHDGEADEIILYKVLGLVTFDKTLELLQYMVRKLKHGGYLIIEDLDLRFLTKEFQHRRIELDVFNTLLYKGRSSMNILPYVSGSLESLGLKIETKRIEGSSYTIKGVRP